MRRYFDTFRRHPWLYLLPLIVMLPAVAIAVNTAGRNLVPYTSEATVAVNLDPTRERPVGEQPLAQQYAELLGELMQTNGFLVTALQRTSLAPALSGSQSDQARAVAELSDASPDPLNLVPGHVAARSASALTEGDITAVVRSRWRQTAGGANTLNVTYRCREALFCTELQTAVLDAFREQVASARQGPKAAAVAFYRQQLQMAQDRLQAMPVTDAGRDAALQAYQSLLSRTVDASLDEALEARNSQDAFKILSPPHLVGEPVSPIRATLPLLAMGLVVGLALSISAVAIATWLEQRALSPADPRSQLDAPLGTVVAREEQVAEHENPESPSTQDSVGPIFKGARNGRAKPSSPELDQQSEETVALPGKPATMPARGTSESAQGEQRQLHAAVTSRPVSSRLSGELGMFTVATVLACSILIGQKARTFGPRQHLLLLSVIMSSVAIQYFVFGPS